MRRWKPNMWHIRIYHSCVWAKTTRAWQETHLQVRSVLCHFRPERAYRFLLLLLFLLSLSSLPIISGKEHRRADMSLMVSLSGREEAQMTKGEAPRDSPAVCVWGGQHRAPLFPGALRTSAWLWSPARSLLWCAGYPYGGQEEGGSHIGPTNPGHTHRVQQRHHLGRSVTFKGAFPWESSKSG